MDNFALDDSFGYLVNMAARRLKYELHLAFKASGYDITPEQWTVLNRLWEQDGLSQVELAERTFKDKPIITRILTILERKGVISRRFDDDDRRVTRVFLTRKGQDLKDKLIPCAKSVLEKGSRNLTAQDIAHLKHTLNQILSNLD